MPRRSTKYIVIHVTATPPNRDIGVKEVDAMHRKRGFNGCGYHFVIRRDGTVETGRDINAVGAHVRGFNSVSIGISLAGGVTRRGKAQDNRTAAQNTALLELVTRLCKTYRKAKVCGHRDLSPDRDGDGVIEPHEYLKECPCFDAIPWAQGHGLPAADIKGTWADGLIVAPPAPDARIVYLQKLLQRAGFEFGAVDGIVGKSTKSAIQRFQTQADLKPTGKFDKATVGRLRAMFERQIVEENVEAAFSTAFKDLDEHRPAGGMKHATIETIGGGGGGYKGPLVGVGTSGAGQPTGAAQPQPASGLVAGLRRFFKAIANWRNRENRS